MIPISPGPPRVTCGTLRLARLYATPSPYGWAAGCISGTTRQPGLPRSNASGRALAVSSTGSSTAKRAAQHAQHAAMADQQRHRPRHQNLGHALQGAVDELHHRFAVGRVDSPVQALAAGADEVAEIAFAQIASREDQLPGRAGHPAGGESHPRHVAGIDLVEGQVL